MGDIAQLGTGRPSGLRERHKETTRQLLVDTAVDLFAERGYDQVTVEDICAVADMSSRTFFRYFHSKEDLIASPIVAMLGITSTSLRAQPAGVNAWRAITAALLETAEQVDAARERLLKVSAVFRQAPESLASQARAFLEWEASIYDELAPRMSGDPRALDLRLLVGLATLALRLAADAWAERDGSDSLVDILTSTLGTTAPSAALIVGGALGDRDS